MSGRVQREDCEAMFEQRAETANCAADHRPKAVWVDVTDSLRDGAVGVSIT